MKITNILNALYPTIKRFTFPLLLCLVYSIFAINQTNDKDSGHYNFFILLYLSTGAILATGWTLWAERIKFPLKSFIVIFAVLSIWGVLFYGWYLSDNNTNLLPGTLAVYLFSSVTLICFPFLNRKNDLNLWAFSIIALRNFCISYGVLSIVVGVLCCLIFNLG